MHFEKTMCDRLGYKYKDIFSHLEFILNKMNNLLNNYGCGLSDKELEMLSQLFLKLETGKIEIIEFTKPIEKYLDVDEIYKENQELKEKIETYEDPEDLTLMFMYCDEKAKDKIRELEKQLEEYQLQNIDLRADIMIQKKSFPNKLIKDKTFYDLYDMPTYEDLLNQQKEFIEYLTKKIDMCDGAIDVMKSDLEEISYGGRIAGKTYIANKIMENENAKKCFTEILSTYKEIIGVSNENNMGNTK